MLEKSQTHKNLSELISTARQKKGWATLKELYREKNPAVDYQTWRHAEAGRRIPHPNSLLEIATILGIDKEDIIIAYCKDKFIDSECHQIVDSFLYRKFIDVDTLLEANYHNQVSHVFSNEQIEAMKEDIRVRLFLSYTYDKELKTSVGRLARFFKMDESEARQIVDKLIELDLLAMEGGIVRRLHRHMTMPTNSEVFSLRRDFLLEGLRQNINPQSHISNFHVWLSDESYKRIMAYVLFAEANFLKLTKDDYLATNREGTRMHIAIVVNKIDEKVGE